MTPQIVNGEGPYAASSSGVGAIVLEPQKQLDPAEMFKSTYSMAKQIRADREAEENRKRAKIKGMLGDLDFKTTGIRSKDSEYFGKGKETLSNFYTHAIMNGNNPDDPKFMKDYLHANTLKKAYEVSVDASIDLNKKITAATAELYKNPNKFEWDKSVAKIREAATADLPKALQMSTNGDLLVPKEWEFEKWATGLFDPKKGSLTPDQKIVTDKQGKIEEVSGFGKWDPEMKTYPKVQEVASWALRNNPDFRDNTEEQWDQMPPQVKSEYAKIAETATKNGNPVTAEDYFAYTRLEPFAYEHRAYKGQTAQAKESAKIYAKGSGVKREFTADIDRYLMMANGDNSIYQARDGGKFSQFFVGKKVGKYVHEGKELPSFIISIQHMGKTPEGRPILKYKTTGTEAMAGQGMVDEDGYVVTNDPNDLIYPMIYSEFEGNAPKYVSAYQERAKELGAWKTGTIDPYAKKVQELSPEYELEDVQDQAKTIDDLNPDKPKSTTGVFDVLTNTFKKIFPSNQEGSQYTGKKFEY